MGKNMQISSQKSKSVLLRPKNEKKIIAISFFVTEICNKNYEILGNFSSILPKKNN